MPSFQTISPVLQFSGAGAPLVLLHCLGVDHQFWDFALPLTSELRLLRYDLPGHGATPVPDDLYLIADLSGQMHRMLVESSITKAHIAGISLGGLIAQDFAARYPGMVDRLILIDTTPRYADDLRTMWALRAKTARKEGVSALIAGPADLVFIRSPGADLPAVHYVRTALAARTPAQRLCARL